MQVDFGATADDYARYRAGFPEAFFRRIEALGIGLAGQRILDLGTGTGALARPFARRGCRVTGLDPSTTLLEQARALLDYLHHREDDVFVVVLLECCEIKIGRESALAADEHFPQTRPALEGEPARIRRSDRSCRR